MRENFTYGSVRGATGDGGPYRDRPGVFILVRQINIRLCGTCIVMPVSGWIGAAHDDALLVPT